MVHEAGLRDSAWSRRCDGRGGGVCGVSAGRGPLMCGSVVAAEGDGVVDGGSRLVLVLLLR